MISVAPSKYKPIVGAEQDLEEAANEPVLETKWKRHELGQWRRLWSWTEHIQWKMLQMSKVWTQGKQLQNENWWIRTCSGSRLFRYLCWSGFQQCLIKSGSNRRWWAFRRATISARRWKRGCHSGESTRRVLHRLGTRKVRLLSYMQGDQSQLKLIHIIPLVIGLFHHESLVEFLPIW